MVLKTFQSDLKNHLHGQGYHYKLINSHQEAKPVRSSKMDATIYLLFKSNEFKFGSKATDLNHRTKIRGYVLVFSEAIVNEIGLCQPDQVKM